MERSKVIFGNVQPGSVYRKAVNSKKKYAKKFGDDSARNYSARVIENEYIGDLLGVKNIAVGDASDGTSEGFDNEKGIIVGNIRMGFGHYRISMAIASAANSMGGLGANSNEITVLEANVTYYNLTINSSIGGFVVASPNREKIVEGTAVSFIAEPASGWKFAGWTGKSASDAGSESTWKTTMTKDIELGAIFEAKGTTTFQAEDGIIDNAINESTNAGFAGTGYINFGTGKSTVQIPVYVEYPGEYTMEMTYANGSGKARSLAFAAPGTCTAGVDGCKGAEVISFEATDKWTTYQTKESTITLPKGASYITFSIVDGNDGPNLDQIKLTEKNVDKGTTSIAQINRTNATVSESRIYDTNGKLVRYTKGNANLTGLAPGIYVVKTSAQGYSKQKMVQVR